MCLGRLGNGLVFGEEQVKLVQTFRRTAETVAFMADELVTKFFILQSQSVDQSLQFGRVVRQGFKAAFHGRIIAESASSGNK